MRACCCGGDEWRCIWKEYAFSTRAQLQRQVSRGGAEDAERKRREMEMESRFLSLRCFSAVIRDLRASA
jgi:hypothetical protein